MRTTEEKVAMRTEDGKRCAQTQGKRQKQTNAIKRNQANTKTVKKLSILYSESLLYISLTPYFFFKKTVYKNNQAEIPEKIRTSVRTSQPQIMVRKRILKYFSQNLLFFVTKSITFTYQHQILLYMLMTIR